MDTLQNLNNSFLDEYLISFNSELNALISKPRQTCHSVNDKFYSSICSNDEENTATFATNLLSQTNDYVFDKRFVNPYFARQNTTSTLLDTLLIEDSLQFQEVETEDAFVNVKRKMNTFLTAQKSQREREKEIKFKTAVVEYRWLYLPKLISPYCKTFLQKCLMTEYVCSKFVETALKVGKEITLDRYEFTDCLFGFTLKDCLTDRHRQQLFNRLFLPGVYPLPKRLNTTYAFNKFKEQFYPENETILDGTDTIQSLFYNTVKFHNINKSQTVATFVKQCERAQIEDNIVSRMKKIQNWTLLFLILRKRYPSLKLKRAERGEISSLTEEYILKSNTLYYYERDEFWVVHLNNEDKPFFSYNFIQLFHHLIQSVHF